MDYSIYTLLILSIFILYLISSSSFKNGMPTCNNFVINTYLYLAFSICFLGLSVHYIHKWLFGATTDYMKLSKSLMKYFFLLFLLSIGLIIYIASSPTFDTTNRVFINHFLWLLFILIFGVILIPRVKSNQVGKFVDEAVYLTAMIFIVMSSLVYAFPVFFSKTFNFMYISLLISLIVVIILELLNFFIVSEKMEFIANRRIISYIVIIIFSMYVSYDTQKVLQLSKICKNYPNYPKTSVSFFLDVINLFSRILFLSSNK